MTDLLLDPIRTLLADRRNPGATHWGDCHGAHVDCAAAALVSEVEALRARVAELEARLRYCRSAAIGGDDTALDKVLHATDIADQEACR